MTRVVLALSFNESIHLLNQLFIHTGYTSKPTAGNQVKIIWIKMYDLELIFYFI
jgi:hypothetical protein